MRAMQAKLKEVTAPDPVRQARIDLAAALRWAARHGFHEGVCNHFSLAVPGTTDQFLINPNRMHWREVRASDLVVIDPDGNLVAGANPPEPTAFFIHASIHRLNPRAACVLHTHMPHATSLTVVQGGRVEWVSQNAMRFYDDVAYDDEYNGLVLDTAEGDRIARTLGGKRVLFLANHGVIVVGETVAQAFDDLYYLERTCELQVIAMQTGRPLRRIPDAMAKATAAQIVEDRRGGAADAHFDALKRLLDREGDEYAD
jgi:ribulose-5-phosphate 4-epimerase/fuculose-1-phosphate aldolase